MAVALDDNVCLCMIILLYDMLYLYLVSIMFASTCFFIFHRSIEHCGLMFWFDVAKTQLVVICNHTFNIKCTQIIKIQYISEYNQSGFVCYETMTFCTNLPARGSWRVFDLILIWFIATVFELKQININEFCNGVFNGKWYI